MPMTPHQSARATQDREVRARLAGTKAPHRGEYKARARVEIPSVVIDRMQDSDWISDGFFLKLDGIWVARRESFRCELRTLCEAPTLKVQLFARLPLDAHGWDRDTIRLTRITERTWLVSRA